MQSEDGTIPAGLGQFTDSPAVYRPKVIYPKSRVRQLSKFLGPAFVVSVAYIDPGNFATNISGGSKFNYTLIWVILVSNLMAIFLQTMSAKLGIATGHNLPEMCARVFPKSVNWVFWIVAEIGAMATDLAEFLGGTLGLEPPVPYSDALCRSADRLVDLHDLLHGEIWTETGRNHYYCFGCGDQRCVFIGDFSREAGLGTGGNPYRCSLPSQRRSRYDCGGNAGRDGDAPCHLSSFSARSVQMQGQHLARQKSII